MSCLTKFLDGPTATNIRITNRQMMPKVTISVCKSKMIYHKTTLTSVGPFLGNESSFWEETFDIENMISDVSVLQNGSFVSLLNNSLNTALTDKHFEKNILPSDDRASIDICYTLNMSGVETFQ